MLDGFFALSSVASLAAGVTGLIAPRALRMKSRWYALPLLTGMIGLVGLSMLVDAALGIGTKDSQDAGTFALALWIVIVFAARALARRNPPPEDVAGFHDKPHAGAAATTSYKRLPPAAIRLPVRVRRDPQPSIPFDRNRPPPDVGEYVRIAYVDSHGEITEREVRNWSIAGAHLEGYCLLRRQHRTFRIDRVLEWQGWG